MEIITKALIYLLVGFLEMFLATQRVSLVLKGKSRYAAGIVFVENILAFFVVYQLISDITQNIPIFLAYSAGSSVGTFINFDKSK